MAKTKKDGDEIPPNLGDHNEQFENFKKQFEDVGKMAGEALPKFQLLGQQFKKILEDQKALESKNVKFIGIDCVAMVFKDHIKIMVVDEEQARKLYGKVGDIDEMFGNLNRKVFDIETELAQEKITTNALKARRIPMFGWWKQLFTRKTSWSK